MSSKTLRVGFMGTPDFALEALKAIDNSAHEIVCVYSQPPRPKGRGHHVQPSPVQAYAESRDIPVFHPKSLKPKDVQEEFAAHNLDVAVVAAYGLLLPLEVLEAPKYGCINIHASLLPRWRGASPIQRSIWAGDEQSGISLMQMDEGLDTGPVIEMQALGLAPRETASSLYDRLAGLGGKMITQTLNKLAENGQLTVKEQEKEGVNYAHLLKKEDGRINWEQTAAEIDRQIRALNPWPGVWTEAGGQRLKIIEAVLSSNTEQGDDPAGTIIDKSGAVQCGAETYLQLVKVQPAGKQAMDFQSAINGGYLKIGHILGDHL